MTARDPRFPMIQLRLKGLGLYPTEIDDEFGPAMATGIDRALARLETEDGIETPKPTAIDVDALRLRAHLPAAYAWLGATSGLPRHLTAALSLYGTIETAGAGDNPVIMAWRDELKAAGCSIVGYSGDAVPWCGLFMAYVMLLAGRVGEVPEGPLWALNWSKFGVDGGQPELGDVLTFKRSGGGHVALYIGEDREGHYHVLGGNQGDKVNIMRIAKARMHACRQPAYRAKPASVRPMIVSAGGAPVSRNEA
jgi:uncharacterized protein (TIGR02594 family)